MKIKIRHLDAATQKIAELNRRAVKLKMPKLGFTVGEVCGDEIEVAIFGQMPVLSGWHLVASLNHEESTSEAILNVVPGEVLPEHFRHSRECEHCRTNRYRKDTFVVRHDNGEYKQVGRNCLAVFLGTTDAERWLAISLWMAAAMTALDGADQDGWHGFNAPPAYTIEEYLDAVESCIWAFGWSNGSSENPTKRQALSYLERGLYWDLWKKEVHSRCPNGRTDIIDIQAAIAWAKNLPTDDSNDYLYNIGNIARAGYVTRKTAGYAASILISFQREQAKKETSVVSRHFGTVGKREVFELTLERVTPLDSMYGVTYLHHFTDASGNISVWFGSKEIYIETGKTATVKATVKQHNERNGIAQTILTRCVKV